MSNPANSGVIIAAGPDDPRLYDVDDDFRAVLRAMSPMAVGARLLRRRFLHPTATTVHGELRVLEQPDVPAHDFFRPGRRFALLGRYSNGQAADDISPTARGLALRFLDPRTPDLGAGLLDLPVMTGSRFPASTASMFARSIGTPGERAAVVAEAPEFRTAAWEVIRTAVSFADYYYHSQVPRAFVGADGRCWLVRYRVIPAAADRADAGSGPGSWDPGELWLPPDPPEEISRPVGDPRPVTFLHEELCARLRTGGVRGLLQVQLRPVAAAGGAANEVALDGSRRWPADRYPWRDLARLHFDGLLDNEIVEGLRFNAALAPADLGITLARSPHSTASVNHLRALAYQFASAARLGQRPRPELQELFRQPERASTAAVSAAPAAPAVTAVTAVTAAAQPRTVCVIGAGPTGLTMARELERAGHRAIVLEQKPEVGGKCASVDIHGRAYDLGGHVCTTQYERVAELAVELGMSTEPTTPHLVYDAADGSSGPQSAAFFRRETYSRYAALRAEQFPRIAEPGLAHSAAALAAPVSQWLAEHGLESMAESLGTGYTAAGYGYLTDEVPALYFVKYAEMTGLLSNRTELLGHATSFTIAGGFGSLWEKVAAQLDDVRTGVRIAAIRRHGGSVHVETGTGVIEADDLVLTVPLDQVIDVLDAGPEEAAVAARIRNLDYYTTLCSASGLARSGFYLVRQHTAGQGTAGHAVAFHHRYPGSDEYACYSYGVHGANGHGGSVVIDRLHDDVARFGGRMETVHRQDRWAFMPHFSSEDLQGGILDRIEALQGQRNTYHAGSLLAFELVECNVGYAQDLTGRFFPPSGDAAAAAGRPRPVAASAPSAAPTPLAAQRDVPGVAADELRAWLVDLIAVELQVADSDVDPDAPLATLGLDSLAVAGIQAELSDRLGYRLPHTLFLDLPTIDAVARYLADAEAGSDRSESQDRHAAPGAPSLLLGLAPARPFYCLGGVVGASYYLRPLAQATGHEPFYGVQAPGLDGAETPPERIEDLAARYLEDIRRVQPHGPYRLGGHSFGGHVAYEMGRRLRAAGEEVASVILLDTYVPLQGQRKPPPDVAAAIAELARMNRLIQGSELDTVDRTAAEIDPTSPLDDQLEQLGRVLGASGALPVQQHIANLLRVYQANLNAFVAYQPVPSDLPVTLIRATGGFPQVMSPGREVHSHVDAPLNGWEHLDLPNLRVIEIAGDHFTVFAQPHLDKLAAVLRDCLTER